MLERARRHSKRQYLNIVKSCDTCQRQTRRTYLCPGSWLRIVLSIIGIASIMLNKRSKIFSQENF